MMRKTNWPNGCGTSSLPDSDQQQDYWNTNLDAANLGGDKSDSPASLITELTFSSVPDIEEMISRVDPAPGKLILEIGSGLGANAVLLSHKGATVLALDISHDRLRTLKSRTAVLTAKSPGKIIPIKARAEFLPFRDNCLDGACSRAVLIHTNLEQTCREVDRTLKPDAPVAFSEPMAHNPLVKLYRLILAPKEWRGITTYFTKKEIATVQRNLADASEQHYYMLSFLSFAFQYAISSPPMFYNTLHWTMKLDNGIRKIWNGYGRFAWFVVITGKKPSR